jgi:hypothetical protein
MDAKIQNISGKTKKYDRFLEIITQLKLNIASKIGVDDNFQPIIDRRDDSTTAILARIADGQFLTANHLVDGFTNE